ncbi:MAG TPA: hybrid sensor histidine kinase/response regulator [Opitutaceae bacterium]|nr:hybrid sensor histidine kinase/response regulator [Opitutaceae bacterium]
MKILVIDDDAPLRRMILKMLLPSGWEVVEATDGQAGVLQARTHLPDIILCDFDMEGINGYQTLGLLRSTDATATIPFILMTGAPERAGMRHSMELGADDYLAKPFDQIQLLKCIEARVARARLNRQQAEQKLGALRTSILAALPHAFKTPLNGILGFSELLATDYNSFSREEIREMTGTIHQSAAALDHLVDRFLNYTELVMTSHSFRAPVQSDLQGAGDVATELHSVAKRVAVRHRRQSDLVLDFGPPVPAITRTHLARLAEEIIDNACKFSAPLSQIKIATAVRADRFVLEVRDAGRGLTAEQITDAGAFLQFDRKRYEQQGTGLGLATARLLATLNGGELALASEPGRGTTVSVTLPSAG